MSSSTNTSGKLNPRNFPRPPLCERTPRHLEVKWNGQTIADTKEGYWVLETYHPPTYYLPPSSLKVPLSKNSRNSYCEWKGVASYYDLANPGDPNDVAKSRIWSYDNPTGGFKEIKDYLSFYAGPWDCYVDGERVIPQPGDFYGGWTTSDIDTTHVKGAPVAVALFLPLLIPNQNHFAMSPSMADLDDTDNDIKAHSESDDEFEALPRRSFMAQAVRKVKGQRIGPRKPRKKDAQLPDRQPQMPQDSPFMKLPPEIRNMIYELAIRDYHKVMLNRGRSYSNTIRINGRKILTGVLDKKYCGVSLKDKIPVGPGQWPEPDLLLMSRQVRAEARPLYYSLSEFQVFARPHELGGISEELDCISGSLTPIPGTQWPIKDLRISLVNLKWEDVHLLLPLAQMCMRYPIGVDHRGQSLGYLIAELLELASRGYKEQWADEWLELQFEAWIENLPGSKEKRQRRSWVIGGPIQESYIKKQWQKMQKCEGLPGDNYGLKDEDDEDSDSKGSRRNLPTSDRKLRSMS